MIQARCIDHVHECRYWGVNRHDPKLSRLSFIESRVKDFLTNEEVVSERTLLVRVIGEERLTRVVNRVLRPNEPDATVETLELTQNKLSRLFGLLKESDLSPDARLAFDDLPKDVQHLFYWAIWVYHEALFENKLGEKKLSERFSLLNEIQLPLLHLQGKTLCEQMIKRYEMLTVLEKQRNIVHILQKISDKIYLTPVQNHEIQSLLVQLPIPLQWQLHGDVYIFSAHRAYMHKWGEKEISRNPKCLVSLRNPNKAGANLLEQYLQEQTALLQGLEKAREIEDFDRLTLLYKMLNKDQWNAVLNQVQVSGRVREWISVIEKTALKKEKIRSDTRHLYLWRGAHPKLDGTQFQVFAPHARHVKLILTAYGREEHCISMERGKFGLFETFSCHAFPGRTYRYLIEDCHGCWSYRTDPFSFSVTDAGRTLESVVTDLEAFSWTDERWMEERRHSDPRKNPLSIYEIHADSWKKENGRPLSFYQLAWAIVEYQKRVPFTHIQIYGLLDNKNEYSWGYQADHFFAPNRRLGKADDFKFLVDLCHQHGIGVILDWIPTHYKHEHNGDRSESLHYYDGTDLFGSEPSYWGTTYFDFNKEETKRLLLASALYWIEHMHVDGLRIDAVSPMICRHGNYQWAAIEFLKQLNHLVHEQYPGVLTIAEETDGFPNVTRPTFEDGLGFDVKLAVHMQYRMRHFFRTPYDQRSWDEHHFGKLLSNLNEIGQREQWMIAHSHDDAASGSPHRHSTIYGSIPTLDPWRKFADMRLFHAWNLLSPGYGHAIHMGDEIGQRWPWNERLQAQEGAVEWGLLDNHCEASFHRSLQVCVGDLNRFYRSRQAFWKQGRQGYQLISHYAPNNVLGIHRFNEEGQSIALFFNFSPFGYQEYSFPLASLQEGRDLHKLKGAREVFSTDGLQYGGTGQFKNTWATIQRDDAGNPTHFHFAFPPLSLVAFEETWN
jgi:1,4-alpha-glucan branching enzyme